MVLTFCSGRFLGGRRSFIDGCDFFGYLACLPTLSLGRDSGMFKRSMEPGTDLDMVLTELPRSFYPPPSLPRLMLPCPRRRKPARTAFLYHPRLNGPVLMRVATLSPLRTLWSIRIPMARMDDPYLRRCRALSPPPREGWPHKKMRWRCASAVAFPCADDTSSCGSMTGALPERFAFPRGEDEPLLTNNCEHWAGSLPRARG